MFIEIGENSQIVQLVSLWEAWGDALGFPKCCIDNFVMNNDREWWIPYMHTTPFCGTGLITCPKCSTRVVEVMAHIQANRQPHFAPFPDE